SPAIRAAWRGSGGAVRRTATNSGAWRGAGKAKSRMPAGHVPDDGRPVRTTPSTMDVGHRRQNASPTSVWQTAAQNGDASSQPAMNWWSIEAVDAVGAGP